MDLTEIEAKADNVADALLIAGRGEAELLALHLQGLKALTSIKAIVAHQKRMDSQTYPPMYVPGAMTVEAVRSQIPVPVPARIGAVVLTNGATDNRLTSGNNYYFVRWAYDSATTSPWIEAGNHEEPYRTDAIGRITEVLSPGVEL